MGIREENAESSRRGILRIAPGDPPDQVPRLIEFRRQHPEVEIVLAGLWRAVIPASNGETVVCRYELKALLDKLSELLP